MFWGTLILGMLIGIGGWMIYWAGLPAIGALMGMSIGGALGYVLSGLASDAWIPVFTGAGLVLGAVAGILLVKALQVYFFFVTGLSLGVAFGLKLLAWHVFGLTASSGAGWLLLALCAILGGVLLVWARRFVVAFVTSVAGALITSSAFPGHEEIALAVALVLYLSIQIGLVHRFVDQETFDRRTRRRLRRHADDGDYDD